MNPKTRWIALAVLTAASAAQAFTDLDADMKEAAADRSARVLITGKAARPAVAPVRTAWVPPTAKSLDGFKPVFPRDPVVIARQRPMLMAKAEPSASAGQR